MRLPSVVIESFLRNNAGTFCVDCLSQTLELPAGQVSMVTQRLRDTLGFRMTRGVCSLCRRRLPVISAVAAS